MGCSHPGGDIVSYAVPINQPTQIDSAVYRNVKYVSNLVKDPPLNPGCKTLQDIFIQSANKFANVNFLGTYDSEKKDYNYTTFGQAFNVAKALGSGIITNGFTHLELIDGKHCKLLGIMSKTREEWTLLDLSNALYNHTMVPFYENFTPENVEYSLELTGIITLFVTSAAVDVLEKVKKFSNLRNLVFIESVSLDKEKKLKDKGFHLFNYSDIIESGSKNIHEPNIMTPNDIFTFSFTSGTTGNPKAVMLTQENAVSAIAVGQLLDDNITKGDVYLAYLPLAHIFERLMQITILSVGATICFYRGNPKDILEDIQLSKPHAFAGVPKIYNTIYAKIKEKFSALPLVKKNLLEKALNQKLKNLHEKAEITHSLYDKIFFSKVKDAFGGRLSKCVTGAAPISSEVLDFLKVTLCTSILEGYGQTETFGGSFATWKSMGNSGHVGVPTANTEFKLRAVPDLEYYPNRPGSDICGEVLIRGFGIMSGYFKNQTSTSQVLDLEGFVATGDIGRLQKDNTLKLIDRKTNFFKLSQGDYVAPENLESIYSRCLGVVDIFVHGRTDQSFLVAIVHPQENVILSIAKNLHVHGDYESVLKDQNVRKAFLETLHKFSQENNMKGIERIQDLRFVSQPFNLLQICTPSLKLKRKAAKDLFAKEVNEMYK